MQRQVDLLGVLDALIHSLRLPPRLVVRIVMQIRQEVRRELSRLAEVTRPG